MKKWKVTLKLQVTEEYIVEAEDEDQATDKIFGKPEPEFLSKSVDEQMADDIEVEEVTDEAGSDAPNR